jgi:hypothetical protein
MDLCKEGKDMGYKTKVQLIKRATSEQWYISLPAQLAAAMEFKQSEVVEWVVEDKTTLVLKRQDISDQILKDQKNSQ